MTNELTFYVPLFTTMEFVVYIGALRVGQIFTNPLGEDESCFEMVRINIFFFKPPSIFNQYY